MTSDEKMNCMFSILSGIKWTNAERYRHGVQGLLKDCSSHEQFAAVEHVLKNLSYRRSNDLEAGAANAGKVISELWGLEPANTLVAGLAEPNKTCGSTAYLRAIELALARTWSSSIYTTFGSAFRHRNGRQNLVLVDDFIGSGQKFSERIDRLLRNPKTADFKIHVVAFAGMATGIDRVALKVENRIAVKEQQEKCISSVRPPEKSSEYALHMAALEKKIFSHTGQYSFGYGQSEAAFFLEAFNIPNNNFPILWWEKYADGTPRPTLFTRR